MKNVQFFPSPPCPKYARKFIVDTVCNLDVEKYLNIYSKNQFVSNVLLIRFQKDCTHKIAKKGMFGLW